ncbi:MAG: entericidin A/B family lipoprotein [Gammaproteobacteria bacterium]|nr:entericidin A/B family lipoprotein [Gammaproteobacteria bacterium]
MKKSFTASIVCALCVALTLLSGCNTVKGAGQDVKDVGNGVTRAAS